MKIIEYFKTGSTFSGIAALLASDIKSKKVSKIDFFQWIFDFLEIEHVWAEDEIENNPVEVLNVVEKSYKQPNFKGKPFSQFETFIRLLCSESFCQKVAFEWMQGPVELLTEMCKLDSFQPVASFICIQLLSGLTEVKAKEGTKPSTGLTSWMDALLVISEYGLQFKSLSHYTANKIFKLHEYSSILYKNVDDSLQVYAKCFGMKDAKQNISAMKSVIKILKNDALAEDEKNIIIRYLTSSVPSKFLVNLAVNKNANVCKTAFDLLDVLLSHVDKFTEWSPNDYNVVSFQVFGENEVIRKLAGNFLIKTLVVKTSNKKNETLLELMNYFYNYKPEKFDIDNYVDTIWSFKYIRSIKNVAALYNLATTTIEKVLLGKFLNAIVKKQVSDDDTSDLVNILKLIPTILTDLQDQDLEYGIFVNVLRYINLAAYENLSSAQHVSCLIKSLVHVMKTSQNSKLLNNVFNVLEILKDKNHEASNELEETAADICSNFEKEFWRFKSGNYSDPDYQISELELVALRMSIILQTDKLISAETQVSLYNTIVEFALEKSKIDFLYEKSQNLLGYVIKTFANLIQAKILLTLTNFNSIKNDVAASAFSKDVKNFIELLENLLKTGSIELFLQQTIFTTLVDLYVSTQENLGYNLVGDLILLVKQFPSNLYAFLVDIIHTGLSTYETNNLEQMESYKIMLISFSSLHQHHKSLPITNHPWKILMHFENKKDFHVELELLFEEIFNYKGDLETPRLRFCLIVSAAIFECHKSLKPNEFKLQIQKLLDLIDNLVSEHRELVISEILHQIFLLLCDNLSRVRQAGSKSNRLSILSKLDLFIEHIDKTSAIDVLTASKNLNLRLSAAENFILISFKNKLQNKIKSVEQ